MNAEIISCPNKNYWYYPLVGEIIELTGQKWVDDGICDRAFIPGQDEGVPLSQVSYTTVTG